MPSVGTDAQNLEAIAKAIDQHNSNCPFPAAEVRMNPYEVERLGWEEIRGLPIVGDAEIGNLLSISRSWVRKQRFNRRHDLPHVFNIDPVLIGSVPRYRRTDVFDWIDSRRPGTSRLGGER